MRIGLDGQPLTKPRTGVGHYTFELARALANLRPDDSFELIAHEEFPRDIISETERVTNLHPVSVKSNVLTRRWSSIGLPRYMRSARLDLFHGTNYQVPLRNAQRNVLTIHDLSIFTHPTTHDPGSVRRVRRRMSLTLRAAARVITPTQSIKNELVTQFDLDSTRVVVIPEAARRTFTPMRGEDTIAARQRLGVEESFILFVGTIEPRKNLQTLLTAFGRVVNETNYQPQLVIAGGEGWLNQEFNRIVDTSDFRERLCFTGHLNDEDLRALYSSCRLFVYPSLYEGFGLPPLEAMACGAPVIASRIPAHEEVLRDKARLVDPLDEQALAHAIVELFESNTMRNRLAESGCAHAANFSWQRTAERTWEVYQAVLHE